MSGESKQKKPGAQKLSTKNKPAALLRNLSFSTVQKPASSCASITGCALIIVLANFCVGVIVSIIMDIMI